MVRSRTVSQSSPGWPTPPQQPQGHSYPHPAGSCISQRLPCRETQPDPGHCRERAGRKLLGRKLLLSLTTLFVIWGSYLLDQETFFAAIQFPAISYPNFCHLLLQRVLKSIYVRHQSWTAGRPSPTEERGTVLRYEGGYCGAQTKREAAGILLFILKGRRMRSNRYHIPVMCQAVCRASFWRENLWKQCNDAHFTEKKAEV